MGLACVLIANRGEIAIRIARACAGLGLKSVAVYSEDDVRSLHVRRADEAHGLSGSGPRAYLDFAGIIAAAKTAGCDAVHPGYGFLSERADFARAVIAAGLTFVGPAPETLALFGDKIRARAFSASCGAPTLRGTEASDLATAQSFLNNLGPGGKAMVKAAAGGGGRGMRIVGNAAELAQAYERCASEARAAFGDGTLYVEELFANARHIEVQIVGDGSDVLALGERECTLQRRRQKLVEIAPSPSLSATGRAALVEAALNIARTAAYRGLGTFEFLVDASDERCFAFIETNARLQVEHTVTEAVYGADLVAAQLRIAGGESLAEIGLERARPQGFAIQTRVNAETMQPDGSALPASGEILVYEPPSGPGVRVDGCGYAGYAIPASFDSLMAKLIVHTRAPNFAAAVALARQTLSEFRIEGVATNLAFLGALLATPEVAANAVTTTFVDAHVEKLVEAAAAATPDAFFAERAAGFARRAYEAAAPVGARAASAPMTGRVVSIDVAEGASVRVGQPIAVLEAMKMEHVVGAEFAGIVRRVDARVGEVLAVGDALVFIEPGEVAHDEAEVAAVFDPEHIRPDLAEAITRHRLTLDEARSEAVARRAKTGSRTARANVLDLCDPGSFVEYGALAVAAQRGRRSMADLVKASPADGVITGIGTVNAEQFGDETASTLVVAYDYSALAGTQGAFGHKKQDRLFRLAAELKRPLALFAEGGGGRPGETDYDYVSASSLDVPTFHAFAKLSGLAPLVGIVHGRCFAGNAALLGCCDVVIATRHAHLGMGGPAMIEGGGLGVFKPEEIGPASVQSANGVIDVLVEDERQAVQVAKKYLSYFQGALRDWRCPDPRGLRGVIPENRLRAYDVRAVIAGLADTDSVLELRRGFGAGMITALIRIEGRPLGLIANNPMHLGGAIDADAADKAARFLTLCDAFDLPVLSLCDTPGFMVGPEAEKTGQVRRVCRMFVAGANLTIPFFTVVLRKGYGLGAQAMAGGSFHAPQFNVSWPTGEFGGMGLEGAVRLGFRDRLEKIADPAARKAEFRRLADQLYERGKATNVASLIEIDDVIDPADTRRWLARGLKTASAKVRQGKKRPNLDLW